MSNASLAKVKEIAKLSGLYSLFVLISSPTYLQPYTSHVLFEFLDTIFNPDNKREIQMDS